jgi:hypothetical protein
MNNYALALVEDYFDREDLRADNSWHNLFGILVIAILAVICRADSRVQVEGRQAMSKASRARELAAMRVRVTRMVITLKPLMSLTGLSRENGD